MTFKLFQTKFLQFKTLLSISAILFALFPLQSLEAQPHRSYNYDQIKAHPRLLLSRGEEKIIKKSISKNPEFKKLDTYIHQVSDGIIKLPPVSYKMDGIRLLAVSRETLKRLYNLSYSYRLTGKTKYLRKAEEELNAVCDFADWNPSHFLDVGEMCMAVAIAYDWLYNDLSEKTKIKIRTSIIEKAFIPSNKKKYNSFLKRNNNWNSVCNAGLVYGALAIIDHEKEQSIAIIERALKSNLLALEVYGPDGNYPEGASYWRYGTTFQVMLFSALESALGSDLGLSKTKGFMEAANFMLFADGPSGLQFNYYDSSAKVYPSSSMFWFANKFTNPSIAYNEINLLKNNTYTNFSSHTEEDRFLPNALIFGKNLTLSEGRTPNNKMYIGHGITPVCLIRTAWGTPHDKFLGIKGGKASDHHGHMDQGTFVYDIGKLRWAMDFGAEGYNALEQAGIDIWNMKQHSQRWEIFRYNNFNHNTISINNQKHNVDNKAEIVEVYDSLLERGVKLDLTQALNLKNELSSATRKAVIINDSYLKIEDSITSNEEPIQIRWNMVTPASATILDHQTIKLTQKGESLLVKFESETPITLAIRPSENPRDYKSELGYNYATYNQPNKGTVMIGFDGIIPPNAHSKFTVTFKEE